MSKPKSYASRVLHDPKASREVAAAAASALRHKADTLYEKRGGRYVPAREYASLDSLPEGAHLVIVRPGVKSVFLRVDPDHAALLAASKAALEAMVDAMVKAAAPAFSAAHLSKPLTKREQALIGELAKNCRPVVFEYASPQSICEVGIDALLNAAKKSERSVRSRRRPK